MSYESIRNKVLVGFPNGKMMLFCEVSSSNVTDWRGRRCWDRILVHPQGSLFYSKESLKAAQTEYVERQLSWLRDFNKQSVEKGWSSKYEEPTLESYDYAGTRFPGGCRIRNGKAFYGGRPKDAAEYFGQWGSPRHITFKAYDKDFKEVYHETYDILRIDLDECYQDTIKANTMPDGKRDVYIALV